MNKKNKHQKQGHNPNEETSGADAAAHEDASGQQKTGQGNNLQGNAQGNSEGKKFKKENSEDQEKTVKMIFSEPKYYNDQDHPIFEANKVYELQGADWIERWIKRGGRVIEDDNEEDLQVAEQKSGPSTAEGAAEYDKKKKFDAQQAGLKKPEPLADASGNLKSPADSRKENGADKKTPDEATATDNGVQNDETVSHDDHSDGPNSEAKTDAEKL